jgi:enamine deaminase RidA (YjgF/YER057c/UK114 family)
VLAAGGSALASAVRLDQFFSDWRAVSPYQEVRNARFGAYIPPSTSVLQPACVHPSVAMDLSMIAVRAEDALRIQPFTPNDLEVPARAGFAPVVAAGDFVFVAGLMAAWKPGDLGGIAPEAQVPPGHLWKGTRIKLETQYLVERKLVPALRAAGASLETVVKAHVYLADILDLPAFNEVWRRYFAHVPHASLVVHTARPGFAIEDARIEVNLVALREGASTTKEIIACDAFVGIAGQPAAVRAGDLLLISGLFAVNRDGAVMRAADARAPHFGSSIERQMEHILDTAEAICDRAGASLRNVVRIQQFHTDLAEFYPAYKVWHRRLGGAPLPFSALMVPTPHSAPDCSVLVDLWIYAPRVLPA